MERIEASVPSVLPRPRPSVPSARLEERRIAEVLRDRALRMVFQPIVSLHDCRPIGFEALARFDDPLFPTPAHAFAAANRAGLGIELEHLAVRLALAELDRLPDRCFLGVNVSPDALLSAAVQETLLAGAGSRIGIEITEHQPVEDYTGLATVLERMRAAGVRIAVDDAGSGYASFRHVLALRPDVIKLDLEIVRDLDSDPGRRALTRSLAAFAAEVGAELVAEGVATPAELAVLQQVGVGHGQGYLFARPGPLPAG